MRCAISTMLLLLSWQAALLAADQPGEKPAASEAVANHWLKVSRDYAEAFVMAPANAPGTPFALLEKPVFRHTQSVRGDDIGAMHLWTAPDSRPAAIGVVFAWSNSKTARTVSYEFHSLTDQPITLRHGDRPIWNAAVSGFQWSEFPEGTQAPAATKLLQRLQANRMARQFAANTTTTNDERWELRLVPTPIYQYESANAGVTFGGMYVFCQGTDTEVILLIEAHNAEEAKPAKLQWRYVLLPFTDYKARVSYQNEHVWESPAGQLNENGKPHYWGFIGNSPKPDFEVTPQE